MEPKVHRRVNKTSQTPRPCSTFRNKLLFCDEELLDPRPTPKLEDSYNIR